MGSAAPLRRALPGLAAARGPEAEEPELGSEALKGHLRLHVRMYIYIYICMYVCIYIIQLQVYKYVYVYIYIKVINFYLMCI